MSDGGHNGTSHLRLVSFLCLSQGREGGGSSLTLSLFSSSIPLSLRPSAPPSLCPFIPPSLHPCGARKARTYVRSLPHYPRKDFSTLFPRASVQAVDLLEKMLVLDGEARLTAEAALAHPYFDGLRDPEDIPEAQPYDDSRDNATLSIAEWQRLSFKEVKSFVPFPRRDSKRRNTLTMS